jgi:hypothetical protein
VQPQFEIDMRVLRVKNERGEVPSEDLRLGLERTHAKNATISPPRSAFTPLNHNESNFYL